MPRGKVKRRCELGASCPYRNEHQHIWEFSHGEEEADKGKSSSSPKKRGRPAKFPGEGVVLKSGEPPKKRQRKPKESDGRTLGEQPAAKEPKPKPSNPKPPAANSGAAAMWPKEVLSAGNIPKMPASKVKQTKVKKEVVVID